MSSKQTFEINPFKLKTLVTPFEYKDMAVNVEQVGYVFKYNIYDPKTKNWYSSYVTDEDLKAGKCECCGQETMAKSEFQPIEIARIADYVSDMARATIDAIIAKNNPDELLKENEKGAVVVEALEENIKQGKKELKDAKVRGQKQN